MNKPTDAVPLSRRTLLVSAGLALLVPAGGAFAPVAGAEPPRLTQGYGHGYTGGY